MQEKSFPDTYLTLGALLRRPYECMSEWLYAELAAQGFDDVRPAYSAVLRYLPSGGARVSQLAAQAGMTKQSMGYLVDQMQSAGLLDVKPDPSDRRASLVYLTERGQQAVTIGVALSSQFEAQLAERVGNEQIATLRSVLEEVYRKLAQADDSATN